MGKDKVKYVCTECGYEAARWLGKCPGCELEFYGGRNSGSRNKVKNPREI